ncbi:MAG: hypothetical protein AAGF67_05355 [Verrucomicrobiota bacterium]
MPFQPLPDTGPEKPKASDFGLFVIRFLATATFFYYQLAGQLFQTWKFIWEKADWDLANQLSEKGLHYAGPISAIMILAMTLSFFGIVFGIFTRINALILLVLSLFVLITPLELSPTLNPQSLAVYLCLFLGLSLGGAGRVSLDYFLAGKKARKNNG